jgi:hypothetical protein
VARNVGVLRLALWRGADGDDRGLLRAGYLLAGFLAALVLMTALAPPPVPVPVGGAYSQQLVGIGEDARSAMAAIHEISHAVQAGMLPADADSALATQGRAAQERLDRLGALAPLLGMEGVHQEALMSERDLAASIASWRACIAAPGTEACSRAATLLSDATRANDDMLARLHAA